MGMFTTAQKSQHGQTMGVCAYQCSFIIIIIIIIFVFIASTNECLALSNPYYLVYFYTAVVFKVIALFCTAHPLLGIT